MGLKLTDRVAADQPSGFRVRARVRPAGSRYLAEQRGQRSMSKNERRKMARYGSKAVWG